MARLIKICQASINTTVGAVKANAKLLTAAAKRMAAKSCTIGLFPELVLGGYPSEDLNQWLKFIERQEEALFKFAADTAGFDTVFCVSLAIEHKGELYNAVAVVCKGQVLGFVPKENLPTYGVFHEQRVFSTWLPGLVETHRTGVPIGDLIFRFPFGVLGTETCEDGWVPDGPGLRRAYFGAEVIASPNASPYRAGVLETRCEMLPTRSSDNNVVHAYCNLVGGNDSLVFDGGQFVHQNGRRLLMAERWTESESSVVVDLARTQLARIQNTTWRNCARRFKASTPAPTEIVFDDGPSANHASFEHPTPENKSFFLPSDKADNRSPLQNFFADQEEAMVLALADYYRKTGAFRCLGVALSGGKDSYVAAVIGWRVVKKLVALLKAEGHEIDEAAAMKKMLWLFSMPSRFNSDTTKDIARELAEELGASFNETSIEAEYEAAVASLRAMTGTEPDGMVLQNLQARIRGTRMWNWSNMTGGLWIQTGNMSEKVVGYTTVGGDLGGAYSILGNMPKTVVIAFAGYLGKKYALASAAKLLATKASAELAAGQEDEKDLMPFPVLDACIYLLLGDKMSALEIYNVVRSMWTDDEFAAMDPTYKPGQLRVWVLRFMKLFRQSLFKWVQSPEAVHLGSVDPDRERAIQLPTVFAAEFLATDELEQLAA